MSGAHRPSSARLSLCAPQFPILPKTLNPQMLMKGQTDEILSLVAHWTTKRP